MTPSPALWLYADMMMNRCVVEPVELLEFGYFCRCKTCSWLQTDLRATLHGVHSNVVGWNLRHARLCETTMQAGWSL